jgi:hypothetical protein
MYLPHCNNNAIQSQMGTPRRLDVTVQPRLCTTILPVVVLSIIVGCASVTAKRTRENDHQIKGLRYWLPMPYLLVREPAIASQQEVLYRVDVKSKVAEQVTFGPGVPPLELRSKPEGGAKGNDKEKNGEGKQPQAENVKTPGPVELVYLPDYCHQYALQLRSDLATLNANVTFADGWKLLGLDSKADNTQIVGKVLDVIATLKTGVAPIAAGEGKPEDSEAVKNLLAQAPGKGPYLYVKKTVVRRLKPGIYAIFTRTNACDAVPALKIDPSDMLGPEEVSYSVVHVGNQPAPPAGSNR